jgi:hypothetical protein
VVEQTATTKIFAEVADGSTEAGKVELIVRLSIKTHPADYHLLESKGSLHGKPGYPFILTIDGQSVLWREEGQIEKTPEYDAKGIRAPEGGEGRRYVLEKRLRLTPGSHRVEMDLPEEHYTFAINLTLKEGNQPHVLEFKPIYRRSGHHELRFNSLTRSLSAYSLRVRTKDAETQSIFAA